MKRGDDEQRERETGTNGSGQRGPGDGQLPLPIITDLKGLGAGHKTLMEHLWRSWTGDQQDDLRQRVHPTLL